METRSSKTEHLAARKHILVKANGCEECGTGREGFEQYWDCPTYEDIVAYHDEYDARRFVFKYTDPRELDVPVAKLPRMKNVTVAEIDRALARCVILCRSCADPRRTRKDDQCKKTATESSPPNS